MNLSKTSDNEILSGLEKLTKSERKITHLILWHILEVETRKLFLQLGYDSLYKYLTNHLGYSESAAYDRMQAARLLRKVPSVAAKIEEGSVKLTQLVKVQQSLQQERRLGKAADAVIAQELIAKIENKTAYETEKIIACELNQTPKAHQKVKPQNDDSVRVEMTFTQEQYELLQKAQSLLSHVVPDNNLAEVVTYLAQNYIQKKEGSPKSAQSSEAAIEKEKPAQTTQSFGVNPESKRSVPSAKRKYIAASVRRAVFARAKNCCEFVHSQTQRRCNSRYQLQIDHIRPLAKGGDDEISNLRILCGVHNRQEALRWGLTPPIN